MSSAVPPQASRPSPEALLSNLARGARQERLTHVHRVPARSASPAPWPDWVTPTLYAALTQAGLASLWSHQLEAAEAAHAGAHVVLSTGTASGKSLGYLLPALSDVVDGSLAPNGRGATALYLAPTKALAHDQLDRLDRLALPGLRAAAYDGDTSPEDRRWVREHANYVLTNPDLLHHSLLPGHEHWAPFLRALRYVVVDECHIYRGVFGSHLAMVLRRLRRVCARYRSTPTFVLASATVADPAVHAGRLVGMPVRAVTEDGSPRAALTFGLWQPGETGYAWPPDLPVAARAAAEPPEAAAADAVDAVESEAPEGAEAPAPVARAGGSRRRSAVAESADLLTDLVAQGVQTVAFARSRAGVEVISAAARSHLRELDVALGDAVAAYRGGYLPEERRELEAVAARWRTGRAGRHHRAGARDRRLRPRRRPPGGLAGNASVDVAAGRPGRTGRGGVARRARGRRRPARHLPRQPPGRRLRPVGGGRGPGPGEPVRPRTPPRRGRRRAAAHRGRRDVLRAVDGRPADQLTASGVLRRRPTGWFWPRGTARRTGSRCVAPAPLSASPTTAPGGYSGPSTTPARTPPSIRAPSTSTRARPTSSSAWTSTRAAPWSGSATQGGPPRPGRCRRSTS